MLCPKYKVFDNLLKVEFRLQSQLCAIADSPNSTKDDTPTSNSVHTATVVHPPVQKRNPFTLPTDLNNNANFEKSYQHKVEITNGKWFLRIFCML